MTETEKNITRLPACFVTRGYRYEQLERTDKKLFYQVVDVESEKLHAFEVFKNKITNDVRITIQDGKKTVETITNAYKETYPSDEAFGVRAWAYTDYRHAISKYLALGEE